jgi:hypothetical protein
LDNNTVGTFTGCILDPYQLKVDVLGNQLVEILTEMLEESD